MKTVLFITIVCLYFQKLTFASIDCQYQADTVQKQCLNNISANDPQAISNLKAQCKRVWQQSYSQCKGNSTTMGSDTMFCEPNNPNCRLVFDPTKTTDLGESCLKTCANNYAQSQYCQAQCSKIEGSPINQQPILSETEFLDIESINQQLEACYEAHTLAETCCSREGSESCLQETSEGVSMLNDLTNAYSLAKSSAGLRGQCESVSILQKKNLALTAYAQSKCQNKKSHCENLCGSLEKKLKLEVETKCSGVTNSGCEEATHILNVAKDENESCQTISSMKDFTMNMAQNMAGLKISQDCIKQLNNTDGFSFPTSPTVDTTKPDCNDLANKQNPICQIQNQKDSTSNTSSSIPSAQSGSYPPGYDPDSGEFLEDPNWLAEKQFEEKLNKFKSSSEKLDNQLAKGNSTSASLGLNSDNANSSARPSNEVSDNSSISPFQSQLFKNAESRKGWSAASKTWQQTLNKKMMKSFPRRWLSNAYLPSNIETSWKDLNLKSLLNIKNKNNKTIEINSSQWIFLVNAQLQYSLFKNGEGNYLSPQTMQRKKPHFSFPGTSVLQHTAEKHRPLQCALKTEPVLATNLSQKRMSIISENLVNFINYNIKYNKPCKNRNFNTNDFPLVKQEKEIAFQRGRTFSESSLKINLDKSFRYDFKSPLWLFTNQTNELFFTLVTKKSNPNFDSLSNYSMYLNGKIKYIGTNGYTYESYPISVEKKNLNGHVWIDSLHYNSEKNGYFSRYLITLYKDQVFLFTFNVHKMTYKKYSSLLAKMISSILFNNKIHKPVFRNELMHKQFLSQIKALENGNLNQLNYGGIKDLSSSSQSFFEWQRILSFLLGIVLLSYSFYYWHKKKKKQS